jgi:hypothetical protein
LHPITMFDSYYLLKNIDWMINLSNSDKHVSWYHETKTVVSLDTSIVVLDVITRVMAQTLREHSGNGN